MEAMRITMRHSTDDDDDNDENYLYDWMPGAATRLARGGGGRGIRGTGASSAAIERASEACRAAGEWITVLPMTPLRPGYKESRHHSFEISDDVRSQIGRLGGVTHLRLNYFQVAALRG